MESYVPALTFTKHLNTWPGPPSEDNKYINFSVKLNVSQE